MGGYQNATPFQVQTAYQCAFALKELIQPYLLRRLKKDVLTDLPKKNEHVLFCQLTEEQTKAYEEFLNSDEVASILNGKRNVLYGIDYLRKICNHPDLILRSSANRPEDYGNFERSGKLKVLAQILPLWKEQGHRVLLFAQTVQMLEIIEGYISSAGFNYYRMDGTTSVKQRIPLVDDFNKNDSTFIFLLSTKVGGLGLNLVGADRVVIFDPDWNPSTDIQARERAWRIGQKRDVSIYRLMTSRTIEEKIYHRQIFKQFLSNKILQDPEQRRFFSSHHLQDLFTLSNKEKSETEQMVEENLGYVKGDIIIQPQDGAENNEDDLMANADGISSIEAMDNTSEKAQESEANKKGDAFILKKLIDGEESVGIISHDSLLEHSARDKQKMEKEATRVAKQAVEALKRSWKEIKSSQLGVAVPTWTGNAGQAGAPKRFGTEKSSFGISSSSLLKTPENPTDQLAQSVHKFFLQRGGSCSSELIVNHFRNLIPQDDTFLFKNILKQIATFDKSSKTWNLKPEFSQ